MEKFELKKVDRLKSEGGILVMYEYGEDETEYLELHKDFLLVHGECDETRTVNFKTNVEETQKSKVDYRYKFPKQPLAIAIDLCDYTYLEKDLVPYYTIQIGFSGQSVEVHTYSRKEARDIERALSTWMFS